jgi:hypothetical protein
MFQFSLIEVVVMLRVHFAAVALLFLPFCRCWADDPFDLGSNAALKYWQAFAQIPKLTDAESTKLRAESLSAPIDAHSRELTSKADYALRMMQRAAALPRCNWGISFEDGMGVLLPHLPAARTLADLACLRARQRFEDGQNTEALDDLVAAAALGRQVSLDGTLIALLVDYAIERRVGDAIAQNLPKLNAEQVKALKTQLDHLPTSDSPGKALLRCESETLDWFIREVKKVKDKQRLEAFIIEICTMADDSPDKRREKYAKLVEECGGDVKGIIKNAEKVRSSYDRIAKKLELPLDEFIKECDSEFKNQADNPLFKLLFPSMIKVREAQARTDVYRAMLMAALAVRIDGKDAVKNYPDPVAGGAFEYVAFDGGFELLSKHKSADGKPLSLTVGKRGQ